MPTHPECLYYLYKGYTHTRAHTHTQKYAWCICAQEKSKPVACVRMVGRVTECNVSVVGDIYLQAYD